MYHSFNKQTINDFSEQNKEEMYNQGYLFTRLGKGEMNQTISLRINLENFVFNSENRRIQRKVEWFKLDSIDLPIDEQFYDFNIQKIGKDFYFQKNNAKIFSANKINELLTTSDSNFNKLLKYSDSNEFGYAISLETQNIFHYAYPFYDLRKIEANIGMGMILKAIQHCLDLKKKYFYLGSVTSEKSLYKLQFNNSEWWDGSAWQKDILKLKELVKSL